MVRSLEKVKTLDEMLALRPRLEEAGEKLVFTNGCFDLLHPGHVRYLEKAASLGSHLLVAVNSDASVRRLKGEDRPVLPENERCEILAALQSVSFVLLFDEETPLSVIRRIRPDVLVKGGDWELSQIVGREEVEAAGGRVVAIPFEEGHSTSEIIERVRNASEG